MKAEPLDSSRATHKDGGTETRLHQCGRSEGRPEGRK